jgi:alpha-ribazole phosphatase
MKYILIRHPKPIIDSGVCYGQSDLDICLNDIPEIQESLTHLKLSNPVIYSSPLKRCLKVANALYANPIVDERLKEIDFNEWEMKSWDEINRDEIDNWSNSLRSYAPGNGESYEDLIIRVSSFIDDTKSDRPLVILTHAGVIRAFMEIIENIPIEDSLKEKIEYGSFYLI